jgi:hypothetical protein
MTLNSVRQETIPLSTGGQRKHIAARKLLPVRLLLALLCIAVAAGYGCAPTALELRFTDLLQNYPATEEPLRIPSLTSAPAAKAENASGTRDIVIMVHPGYSLFFRSRERNLHSEVKYDLLKLQLDSEAESIRKIAQSGQTLILVIPGNYQRESIAPLSYTHFLNDLTEGSSSASYIYSESASSGSLSPDSMVTFYRYLQSVRADRILIGGGYIGRCEREFYSELATYIDNIRTFIVPELSSVSPDDIDDKEARAMLDGLLKHDYTLIRQFISRKSQRSPNVLSLEPSPVAP